MCGRYSLVATQDELEALFGALEGLGELDLRPRYNIAPSQRVPIVRATSAGVPEIVLVQWGLVPSWAKERKLGYSLINARAESVTHKPSFCTAFRRRRCLVPASAFYEWQAQPQKRKQPFAVRLRGGAPFAFAGVWETWTSPEGEVVPSCCILTCEANALVQPIHGRMPVILPQRAFAAWLDPSARREDLERLLAPYPADEMQAYPVSTRVNKPQHDDAACLAPLETSG